MVHIHVRDPKTGEPTGDPVLFREVVARIRDSGSDVLINLTSGEGGRYIPSAENPRVAAPESSLRTPEERVRHIEELRPDICSLDVGTMNFGETVFMNTPAHLRIMAQRIKDAAKSAAETGSTSSMIKSESSPRCWAAMSVLYSSRSRSS